MSQSTLALNILATVKPITDDALRNFQSDYRVHAEWEYDHYGKKTRLSGRVCVDVPGSVDVIVSNGGDSIRDGKSTRRVVGRTNGTRFLFRQSDLQAVGIEI